MYIKRIGLIVCVLVLSAYPAMAQWSSENGGDMRKSVYDKNRNGAIDISKGGTDLSSVGSGNTVVSNGGAWTLKSVSEWMANTFWGSSSNSDARTNLGLGNMATQNKTAVEITGGTINGASVTNLPVPTGSADAATKNYVDTGYKPAFLVFLSGSSQPVTNFASIIQFNNPVYDTASKFDASSFRYKIPASMGGVYVFYGCAIYDVSNLANGASVDLYLRKNGGATPINVAYASLEDLSASVGRAETLCVGPIAVPVSADDTMELFSTSSDQNYIINAASLPGTYFGGYRLGN